MNLKETNTALALVQAFDRRTVGEVDVRAWQSVLGDLEVADVMEAVRRHYADSSEWMMPAHVRRGVAEIVAERNRPEPSPYAPGQYGCCARMRIRRSLVVRSVSRLRSGWL